MSMNVVDVGTPPDGLNDDWTTTVVRFHGFANLPTTRGEKVQSPEFSCLGHQWKLRLFPGGDEYSDEGYVALGLTNRSNTSIELLCSCYQNMFVSDSESVANQLYSCWCPPNFAKRSKLIDSLVNGSLIIEVRMRPISTDKSITQFIPKNPIHKNVINMFMDEETADVIFEVDNGSCQSEEHINKKSKTIETFFAHRFILQNISTMLAELCKPDESGVVTTVSITDVKPEIFKHMIYYTYGGKLSDKELKDNAKDIIDACDKYG